MSSSRVLFGAMSLFLLTSCGYLAQDAQSKAEQEFLQKDQQVADVIEQIRTQGIEAVAKSAEAGSVAACVASRLATDPVGKLVTVEGALTEGARITELMAQLEQMLQSEPTLADLGNILEQGAAAARYASQLIRDLGFEGALAAIKQMAAEKNPLGQTALGEHFQLLIASCQSHQVTPEQSADQA